MVEPTGVKRKLTVILAADAKGYTRLMREAEEPTLETLTEYRDIIDGLIARHDGRVFSTAGDSVVAEFGREPSCAPGPKAASVLLPGYWGKGKGRGRPRPTGPICSERGKHASVRRGTTLLAQRLTTPGVQDG